MSLRNWKADAKLIKNLSMTINNDNISHAYIIEADSFVDKVAFAKDFIKAVLCKNDPGFGCDSCITCKKIDHDNYEDLYSIESDGLSVKNDAIMNIQAELKRKPSGGDRNIVVIKDADTLTDRAQTRLLKTLEEPIPGTIILLLSENKENLLITIRSRCITFRLNTVDTQSIEDLQNVKNLVNMVNDGDNFYNINSALSEIVKDRSSAFRLLDGMERVYREYLLMISEDGKLYKKNDIIKYIRLIEETRRDILSYVNHSYALKNLLLKIGG